MNFLVLVSLLLLPGVYKPLFSGYPTYKFNEGLCSRFIEHEGCGYVALWSGAGYRGFW